MDRLHVEESWKDKCERYIHRQVTTSTSNNQHPAETPRSARSIIPPVRNSGKYNLQTPASKPNDIYIRKAFTLSSIHGLPFVTFLTSRLGRITWSVIVLIGLCCLAYFTQEYVRIYLENARHFEVVSGENDHPEFPSVTLCNLNTLHKLKIPGSRFENLLTIHENAGVVPTIKPNKLELLNSLTEIKRFMRESKILDPDSYIEDNKPWLDIYSDRSLEKNAWSAVKALLDAHDAADLWRHFLQTSKEEAKLFGHAPDGLVVKCKQGRESCENSSIVSVTHPHIGLCTEIKGHDINNQDLSLLLDVEADMTLGLSSDSVGIAVYMHAPGDPPFHYPNPMIIEPGHKYTVTVQEKRVKKLQPCALVPTQLCLEKCIDDFTWDICRCRSLPDKTNTCHVFNAVQAVCHQTVLKMVQDGILNCNCTQSCSSTDYSFQDVSQSTWPSQPHMVHFLNEMSTRGTPVDAAYVRSNLISLQMHLSPDVEVQKEVLNMSFYELLSHIGGLSCLLIGVSIISVLEFLFLLSFTYWQKYQATSRTGKNRVRHPAPTPISAPQVHHVTGGPPYYSGSMLPPFKANVMYLPAQPTSLMQLPGPHMVNPEQFHQSIDQPINQPISNQLNDPLSRSRDSLNQQTTYGMSPRATNAAPKKARAPAPPPPLNRQHSKSNGAIIHQSNSTLFQATATTTSPTSPNPVVLTTVDARMSSSKSRQAPLPPPPAFAPPPPPPRHHEHAVRTDSQNDDIDADDSTSNDMYFEISESRMVIKETRRDDVPPLW